MANTHLAYFNLDIDKFFGTDPDQDAETLIKLTERKINFALGDAPADAGEVANNTFFVSCFLLYSEDQPNTILPTLLPGRLSEQTLSLDFQMEKTNFHIEGKWNIVFEEMEKEFETFYTVSNERLIEAGPMT